MAGRVLVVAGSDSGGGAGIQADIKTVMALGGYATTAITALTAQNTVGVHGVLPVPPDFVAQQMQVVLADIGADAVKTGMLFNAAVIRAVCDVLDQAAPALPLVVDPVMVAKGGAALLAPDAVEAVVSCLVPRAAVVTPNLPEAAALVGFAVADEAAMRRAASVLLARGARAVLLKGGHLPGDEIVDVLATSEGVTDFRSRRIESRHTHGTGCTLASAVATGLALGVPLPEAVRAARDYVRAAMAAAPGLGRGHGPMQHAVSPALA